MNRGGTVGTHGILPFGRTREESWLTIYCTDHGFEEAASFKLMGGDLADGGRGSGAAPRLVVVRGGGELYAGGGRRGMRY